MNTLYTERPAPFENSKAYVHLLLFTGITCLFISGMLLIIGALQYSGIANLALIDNPDAYSDPFVLRSAKIIEVLSDIATFILPAIVFAMLVSRKKAQYLQIDKTGQLAIVLLGGILMLCASPLINFLAELNNAMQLPSWLSGLENWMKSAENTEDAIESAFLTHQSIKDLLVNLFMMGFVAAIAEEIFFRGVLQKIIVKITKNIHSGIWITAVIFSAIHFQFYGFLPRMFMGAYLGYIFYWSGSLWVPVFAHFLNNATAVLFAFLEERNLIPDTIDKVGSQTSEYGYVIGSAVVVVLLLIAIYRLSGRNNAFQVTD